MADEDVQAASRGQRNNPLTSNATNFKRIELVLLKRINTAAPYYFCYIRVHSGLLHFHFIYAHFGTLTTQNSHSLLATDIQANASTSICCISKRIA